VGTEFDKSKDSTVSDVACVDCSQGFANPNIGAVCMACPMGKYTTVATKATSCANCPAGQTTKAIGAFSAKGDGTDICAAPEEVACRAGEFIASDKSCQRCAVGTYNPPSTSPCILCPQGKTTFPNRNGPSGNIGACVSGVTCRAGSALSMQTSAGTEPTCALCKVGSYSNTDNSRACVPCEAGYFAATVGSTVCTVCEAGKTSRFGASVCVAGAAPCSAGKYVNTGSCIDCPAGRFSILPNSDRCMDCPYGSYSAAAGSTTCAICSDSDGIVNKMSGASACFSTLLQTCAGGQYLTAAGDCADCAAGTFQPFASYARSCRPCPRGTYTDLTKATECKVCENLNASGSSTCPAACAAGSYMPTGSSISSACIVCPAGTFNSIAGTSGLETCKNCPQNTYSEITGMAKESDCTRCAKGFTSPAGSIADSACVAATARCRPGFYASSSTSTEGDKNADGKTCSKCPIGKYSTATDAAVCTACEAGKSTLLAGTPAASLCIAATVCPAGKYLSAKDQYMWCQPCLPGFYSAEVGATSAAVCEKCPDGQTTSTGGQVAVNACTAVNSAAGCPAGTYGSSFGRSVSSSSTATRSFCLPCPPGTFNPSTGSTSISECIRCEAEYGSPFGSTSADACTSFDTFEKPSTACPPGTTNVVINGVSKCNKCPQGMYSVGVNSVCVSCPSETTSPIGSASASACVAQSVGCPMGMYGAGTRSGGGGSAGCTACPPGGYLDFPGAKVASQCKRCPADLPAPEGSVSKRACGTSQSCPAGSYSVLRGSLYFCRKCPENTYNSDSGAESVSACTVCPTDLDSNEEYTSPRGSTALTDCVKGAVQPTMAPTTAIEDFRVEMDMTLNGVSAATFNGDAAYADAFAAATASSLFDPDAPANVYSVTNVQATLNSLDSSASRRLQASSESSSSTITFAITVDGSTVSAVTVSGMMTASVNAGVFDSYLQMSATSTGASGMQNATAEDCSVTPTSSASSPEETTTKKGGIALLVVGSAAAIFCVTVMIYCIKTRKARMQLTQQAQSEAASLKHFSGVVGSVEMTHKAPGGAVPTVEI